MNNDYIDKTIEAIIKAFEDNQMENVVQYKKLKEIEEKRIKGRNNDK